MENYKENGRKIDRCLPILVYMSEEEWKELQSFSKVVSITIDRQNVEREDLLECYSVFGDMIRWLFKLSSPRPRKKRETIRSSVLSKSLTRKSKTLRHIKNQ